jgi:HTH-type transcriptional regulator / antitoxin HigA
MPIQYTVIKTEKQYYEYCNRAEYLDFSVPRTKDVEDEIELLVLLIEKWDEEHNTFTEEYDPIELLDSLMKDHKMKAKDLADLLKVSKGYVSDILNYKKGLSKEVIRKLSERFKIRQEAFNKPYKLKTSRPRRSKNTRLKNKRKRTAA